MYFKDGVIMAGLKMEMRLPIKEAANLCKKHGTQLEITCGLEHNELQSPGTLHWYGYAIDFKPHDPGKYSIKAFFTDLKQCIPHLIYDIVKYDRHVHSEYDPADWKDVNNF